MKRIVFKKLTVKEEKNVLAGDGEYLSLDSPSLDSCEPDTPGNQCGVPTPRPRGCGTPA